VFAVGIVVSHQSAAAFAPTARSVAAFPPSILSSSLIWEQIDRRRNNPHPLLHRSATTCQRRIRTSSRQSTLLHLHFQDATDLLLTMSDDGKSILATSLGYLIGLGSLLLYTPIAYRVYRQGSANGLAQSTWWLKVGSYTCSDIFYVTKGYPISTYVETLIITVEAAVVLLLVAYYQRTLFNIRFVGLASMFVLLTVYGLAAAPPEVVAFGQVSSVALNSGALVPQFVLNGRNRTKGDYSPVTAGLASVGCAIRIFTTIALADSDAILLWTFALSFLLNSALLIQILYYGVAVEGLSPLAVCIADVKSAEKDGDDDDAREDGGEEEEIELCAEEKKQIL